MVVMSAARGIDGKAKEAGAAVAMRRPFMPQALIQVIERYVARA